MHTVGAVLVEPWYEHENVTAIIWAGVPGQESGNAITDILYGKVNPGGKTPFTWGQTRRDYGPSDVIYTPNNGEGAPQDNFVEGIFIDYRYFDRFNETPIYEFGYGLSYTTFSYSNLQITANDVPAYELTTFAPRALSLSSPTSTLASTAPTSRLPATIPSTLSTTPGLLAALTAALNHVFLLVLTAALEATLASTRSSSPSRSTSPTMAILSVTRLRRCTSALVAPTMLSRFSGTSTARKLRPALPRLSPSTSPGRTSATGTLSPRTGKLLSHYNDIVLSY
jgi:hypothetical protein